MDLFVSGRKHRTRILIKIDPCKIILQHAAHIIHILHDFDGDIPEYFPRGDRKTEGDITLQGFPVTEGKYSGKFAREVM